MTTINGQIDSPPPAPIAERFSGELAEAILDLRQHWTSQAEERVRVALSAGDGEVYERVRETIIDRRVELDALLGEVTRCATELGDALGFQKWSSDPTNQYKPASLITARSRRKSTIQAANLIEELRMITRSESGFVNLDAPAPQIRIEDLYKRPAVRVPAASDFGTKGEGYESPDPRITGDRR